jgi:hypothetical protein
MMKDLSAFFLMQDLEWRFMLMVVDLGEKD